MPLSICAFLFLVFSSIPLRVDSSRQTLCSPGGGLGQVGSVKLISWKLSTQCPDLTSF